MEWKHRGNVRSRCGSSQADSFRGECNTLPGSSARRHRSGDKAAAAGSRSSRTAALRARRTSVSPPPSRDGLCVDRGATLLRKIQAGSSSFTSANMACARHDISRLNQSQPDWPRGRGTRARSRRTNACGSACQLSDDSTPYDRLHGSPRYTLREHRPANRRKCRRIRRSSYQCNSRCK
jgi:hypothetical protein